MIVLPQGEVHPLVPSPDLGCVRLGEPAMAVVVDLALSVSLVLPAELFVLVLPAQNAV